MKRRISFLGPLAVLAVLSLTGRALSDGVPQVIASFHDKAKGTFASLEKAADSDSKTLFVGTRGVPREAVWQIDWNHKQSIFFTKPFNGDEFKDAEILAADLRDDVAVVVFKLKWDKSDPKTKHSFRHFGWYPSDAEFQEWDGSILFLRSFVRREGEDWTVYLSVFPETMWNSVRGEQLVEIVIHAKGEYDLVYKKQWEVRAQEGRSDRQKEVLDPNGMTSKVLRYNEAHNFLLTKGHDNANVFIPDAEWWAWKDSWDVGPFDQKQPMERMDLKREADRRAEKAGVRGVSNVHL